MHPEKILGQLSDNHRKAVESYKKSLFEGMKIKTGEVLEDQEAIHHFQAQILKLPPIEKLIRFIQKKNSENSNYKDIEYDFVDLMNGITENQQVQLPKDMAARKYLVEQLLSRGYTRIEIAKRLGISRKTLYNIIKAPLPISGNTGFG